MTNKCAISTSFIGWIGIRVSQSGERSEFVELTELWCFFFLPWMVEVSGLWSLTLDHRGSEAERVLVVGSW
jgi:hypothetical protein